MSDNLSETTAMATSQMAKASNGPAKTGNGDSRSLSVAQSQPVKAQGTISAGVRGLELKSLDDMWRMAQYTVSSGLAPRAFDKPEKVLIAMQMGAELGLSPMQSLNNIAVINGRPSVWGDAVGGLIRRSPQCKSLGKPKYTGSGETRVCTIKAVRTNGDEAECSFGYADAKRAGLLSKDTYKSYPDRMYYHRALGYVADELFQDVFMGVPMAEEIQDVDFSENPSTITSGDDAPLNSLDDAAELLGADDDKVLEAEFARNATGPTAEELADPDYNATQTDIPF